MDMVEAVRLALQEVGDVGAQELVEFIKDRFAVTVAPKMVPLIKATLLDKERLKASRQRRAAETAAVSGTPPA